MDEVIRDSHGPSVWLIDLSVAVITTSSRSLDICTGIDLTLTLTRAPTTDYLLTSPCFPCTLLVTLRLFIFQHTSVSDVSMNF